MKITALDIRKQEFARTFRGYDPDEVDSFLQVIATGWQEMVDDLRRSEEKINEQQMKLQHYMKVEEALEEALQTARSSARQTIESAEKKASDMLEDAENRIVHLQKEADANRLEIKRETARYAVRQQEIVAKLRAFLVSEMEMLRHFEADTGERTLAQPTSRREIEMIREAPPAIDDESDSHEHAAGVEDSAEDGHRLSDEFSNDQFEAEGTSEAHEETDEDPGHHEGPTDTFEEDDWDEEDEWDEDEWDDEELENEEPESLDKESHHTVAGSADADSIAEDHSSDWDSRSESDEGTDPSSHDSDQGGAGGWRVTPVFESASDGSDVREAESPAMPEDDSDDEIKKIHEILKGLDEEQDAEEH